MGVATAYGACQWGYNQYGCFLWARALDNGRIYVQRDFKFRQMPIEDVAQRILQITRELEIPKLKATYADPEMFDLSTDDNKPRVEAPAAIFSRFKVPMTPAPGDRIQGWQRVQDFLRPAADGRPWGGD